MWGRAAARGGEVMACRSGAALRVLAAGSPRGCAQHRRSQPWAGGVPSCGLSRRPPPPPLVPGWASGGGRGLEGEGGGGGATS